MARKVVEYAIFKNFKGMEWPGDHWHGPFKTLGMASNLFRKHYEFDADGEKRDDFRIIKITYVEQKPVKEKKRGKEDKGRTRAR